MSYSYEIQKKELFTDQGQRIFLKCRDSIQKLLKLAGAVRFDHIEFGAGDSWTMLACVDRLLELGEISEVSPLNCMGQHRVFISKGARE
jgi:hypothetical protein